MAAVGFSPRISDEQVAILLCTLNGQSFLSEQLSSIAAQTHTSWELWTSDDGSRDRTRAILQTDAATSKRPIRICAGPAQGFAANFLSLVRLRSIQADYYAFADQDDFWEPEKLSTALEWLRSVPSEEPALYCCRARLIDERGQDLGFSPKISKPPAFKNALIENICSGNTMVFNDAARKLLLASDESVPVIAHDWWTYLVISGCGGRIFYDSRALVCHRLHRGNTIGPNGRVTGIKRSLGRQIKAFSKGLRTLANGEYAAWMDANLLGLQRIRHLLSPENQLVLQEFAAFRKEPMFRRVAGLMRSGVYRQRPIEYLGVVLASLFGKI
jgi:glycosyltransferase involved in cell wall biosynthesis